jgi:ABC-type multidrug transport system ATPase subunit
LQHDVLFGDLTVEEHLTLFASLKGLPPAKIPDAVAGMIKEVGCLYVAPWSLALKAARVRSDGIPSL